MVSEWSVRRDCPTPRLPDDGFAAAMTRTMTPAAIGGSAIALAHRCRGHFCFDDGLVVSMEVELAEAARMMGVSAVRARQLAREGRLRARRVGGRWLVDAASVPSAPRRGRPMSPRIAWALVAISSGGSADWIEPRESCRLRQALDRLVADGEPEMLLRSCLASRVERELLSASELDALHADPRLVRTLRPVVSCQLGGPRPG